MIPRETDILVHVESNDIAKGDLAGFVSLHENAVDDLWAATGRKTEHKRLLRCGIERFDPAWFESQLYASAFPEQLVQCGHGVGKTY